MLEGLFMLLSLSTVMAIASFLAGSLPLSFSLSQSQLRLVSTVGMGVLVGTSLIVIIPEGVETLYSASANRHDNHASRRGIKYDKAMGVRWKVHERASIRSNIGSLVDSKARIPSEAGLEAFNSLPGPVIPDGGLPPWNLHERQSTHSEFGTPVNIEPRIPSDADLEAFNSLPGPVIPDKSLPLTDSLPPSVAHGHHALESSQSSAEDHGSSNEPHTEPHAWMGLSLILGFILMYLVDQVPRYASAHTHNNQQPYHISLDNLSQGLHRSSSQNSYAQGDDLMSSVPPSSKSRSRATTTGLVIHAAADGIALGASSSTADERLGFVIFFAIMVHKAPAAFGLTSVLLKQGLSKRVARGHLVIFSLAAPLGALTTWALVRLLGRGVMGGNEGTQFWTGVLLLFSAGTFLYVAMHTMQEDEQSHPEKAPNGYTDGQLEGSHRRPEPRLRDTMAAVVGMLLPLVTQIGHHHH